MVDTPTAEDEVVGLAADLIRIDTTNTGDPQTLKGERKAAEYVAAKLEEVGYEVTYVESGDHPGRGNVVARLPGADASRDALLVHGHLDVVPADAGEWSVDPFSGEIRDGYLWGRGAIDMKHMVAMSLAVARQFKREGTVPARDLIFAFVADEEAGGFQGVQWLVEHRRELFEGATEAISEVGGFSVTLGGTRAYLVQTAEKGLMWLRLRAEGTPGHGSMLQEDNAVAKLAAAVTRLENHRFPLTITPPVREFLDGVSEMTGWEFPDDDIDEAVARLGNLARVVGATLRDTTNLTMFNAGYKANVVPSTATAAVDGRMLPGREEAFERELLAVLGPDITAEWDKLPPVQTTFDGPLVDRMADAITAEDPGARCLPYMVSAGTDAKGFARLGIRSFGFAPLRLPPDLEFANLFHGIDERVPVDALTFGVRVLARLLSGC